MMDINDIVALIRSDPCLASNLKDELLEGENRKKLATLLSGAGGAALGLALARYKKMGTTAQVVLSSLGFGAGVLIYKYWNREKFLKYNEKTQMYELQQ